jgi:hypothetical protein
MFLSIPICILEAALPVNIFLIPYTWYRHLAMAFWCAAWGLAGWACILTVFVKLSPTWHPAFDGSIVMSTMAGTITLASIAGEAALRRRSVWSSSWRLVLAMVLAVGLAMASYWLWTAALNLLPLFGVRASDISDVSLVTFRFRVGAFALAGLASGVSPLVLRKGSGWFQHLVGGMTAGLAAGCTWHALNFAGHGSDLFWAGAGMGAVWGFFHGLLCWGVPDELYAGWLRVLSWNRYSRRIPIDAQDGVPIERFVGHFTRGLDLFLPAEDGVMEMHLSVVVDENQQYSARGLSLQPTRVIRFLERVNLQYDPRRPAPLQTRIDSGDRIEIGDGVSQAEVEFIMLPKEER